MSTKPIHKDIFDVELSKDDFVLVSMKGGFIARLGVGKIIRLNPKLIKVRLISTGQWEYRYGYELLRVTDDPRLSAYLLKNGQKPAKRRRNV